MAPKAYEVQRARSVLLDTYGSDTAFAAEQQERRERHRGVLGRPWEALARALATCLGWSTPVAPQELGMGLPTKKRPAGEPFDRYFDELLDCCRRWKLDYNWAPTECMWRDYFYFHPDLLERGQQRVWAEVASAQGKPAYIEVMVPTVAWEEGPKDDLLASVERQLQQAVPRPAKVRGRYNLEEVAKLVHARNVLGLTPGEIVSTTERVDPKAIGEAIRSFDRLVGGGRKRPVGAPRGRKQRRLA